MSTINGQKISSTEQHVDPKRYGENYDRIFGKRKEDKCSTSQESKQ